MNLLLSDNGLHLKFAPLTLTRPLGELRMGMFTLAERWAFLLDMNEVVLFQTENPFIKNQRNSDASNSDLIVNAAVIPSHELAEEVKILASDEILIFENTWIAKKGLGTKQKLSVSDPLCVLENRWDLYLLNEKVLKADFEFYTKNKLSQPLPSSNTLIGDRNLIFLEEGAQIEACILNTTNGPIYLGKNSEVMEGSMIRGPFSLSEGAGVKMGTKIYGGSSIGPHCKVGGEISNCIFLAYSNKGHDGFLGNSYIGAWCNLGADTNSSNLKNNYSPVKTYDFESESLLQTDVTFMGLFMGDHSKCSINTMFNTATVVGVSANIFSSGFPKKYVPSFAWGENDKFNFDLALEVAEAMMKRRGLSLSESEIEILKRIYDWAK
jgi:UDP-N-acetylglucosamine diphosphorylase/glucosamine-1-phosphate N-acetyltransferase